MNEIILITGAYGMVGQNTALYFKKNKPNITLLTPKKSELDLLDKDNIQAYLEKHKPTGIIHCAGRVGGIVANMNALSTYMLENMLMGLYLFSSALNCGVKKAINLASSCAYPKYAPNPLKESDLLNGSLEPTNEGYALAKLSVMKYCEYVSAERDVFYKTLVPCNLYGEFDKFEEGVAHMIPGLIARMHRAKLRGEKEFTMWGDGSAKREYLNAKDLAKFIALAYENITEIPSVMNVGSGIDYTIEEYYKMVAKALDYQGEFVKDLSKPVGMQQKLMDISKQKALKWELEITLEQGIKEAYEYYLKNCV
ncbi:GDP-L-fucose synthase family protein [Helicobacter cetorum]|uniref:GDP-L-fucose synthase n=1 Tax=Helicobacter cetorum (strain ATCC BAA-429 / MIT 00-7128) TaxID=182217 RepID=I0EK61_HELC0|nr:GDP-L-fucose synthase [Helicobacter cetorum]AFI03330.1 GDP-fucose synthetase [Helicobacter cetorum MIT 00-7128]